MSPILLTMALEAPAVGVAVGPAAVVVGVDAAS